MLNSIRSDEEEWEVEGARERDKFFLFFFFYLNPHFLRAHARAGARH